MRDGKLTPYQAAAVLQGKTKGLVIGGYDVLDKLGAGSMGIVFKAIHRQLKQVVALKLLPPSLARHPTAVIRFRREAKAAAKLSHPNIVAVIDADEFRGLHFLVMEYVEGRDLSRLVREQGTLSLPPSDRLHHPGGQGARRGVCRRRRSSRHQALEPDGRSRRNGQDPRHGTGAARSDRSAAWGTPKSKRA